LEKKIKNLKKVLKKLKKIKKKLKISRLNTCPLRTWC